MELIQVVKNLKQEILKVLNDSLNKHDEAQRKMLAKAAPRSLHFSGSFDCYIFQNGLVHINIPTGTDKTEKLHDIINRVLQRDLNITLADCRVVKDAVGMSNKVIEFTW